MANSKVIASGFVPCVPCATDLVHLILRTPQTGYVFVEYSSLFLGGKWRTEWKWSLAIKVQKMLQAIF